MLRTISVSRPSYNQDAVIKYDEASDDVNLIKKKELTIKSMSALQLLLTTLSGDQTKELNDIIDVLEDSYNKIQIILNIRQDEEEFYAEYIN